MYHLIVNFLSFSHAVDQIYLTWLLCFQQWGKGKWWWFKSNQQSSEKHGVQFVFNVLEIKNLVKYNRERKLG